MSAPRLTRARLRDVPGLARVLWSHTRAPGHPRARTALADLRLLARLVRRDTVWLIRDSRGPAAFLAQREQQIHALYVHARARRAGMGRALLHRAKASQAALSIWTAQDNHAARRFYAAEGFVTMGYSDGRGNDEALPEVLMIWSATPHVPQSRQEAAA
ncbi:GNAT family N-acetyltransferase [Pseudooceanicola sp. 200-1SW]|uniref:GNAT family N-acetyltransferase n=1 Tax=Pseudooceanicola sp. 200-1SW TaxID=3425949 RepID=UPI003D7FB271